MKITILVSGFYNCISDKRVKLLKEGEVFEATIRKDGDAEIEKHNLDVLVESENFAVV
jgi:hypothetical protein